MTGTVEWVAVFRPFMSAEDSRLRPQADDPGAAVSGVGDYEILTTMLLHRGQSSGSQRPDGVLWWSRQLRQQGC